MVVGLVLVSSAVAAACAVIMLLMGGGWLSVLGIYVAAGMVTTVMLLLRLIFTEMGKVEDQPEQTGDLTLNTAGQKAKAV